MKPRNLKKLAILGKSTQQAEVQRDHHEQTDDEFPNLDRVKSSESVPEAWLDSARESLVPLEAEYRRTKSRLLWDQPLELEFEEETHRVQALNVSRSGLGLVSRFPIPIFKRVRIRRCDDAIWYVFTVVHSSQTVGGWKIGLVAGIVTESAKGVFSPDELTGSDAEDNSSDPEA